MNNSVDRLMLLEFGEEKGVIINKPIKKGFMEFKSKLGLCPS